MTESVAGRGRERSEWPHGAVSWQGDGRDDFALLPCHMFVLKPLPLCGQVTWDRGRRRRLPAHSPFWDLDIWVTWAPP